MRTLADLFEDRAPIDDTAPRVDHAAEQAKFHEMVGPPRVGVRRGTPRDDTMALVDMVERATLSVSPVRVAGASDAVKASKRGTKRVDWLNVSVAILAVAVVAGVSVFAGIQIAKSSPAAAAVRSLAADEASLANGENAVRAAAARVDELIGQSKERAATLGPALDAVSGYVPDEAINELRGAISGLGKELDSIEVPDVPAVYERPVIDTDDLRAVGAQIDAVRERSGALQSLTDDIRAVREKVVAAGDGFDAKVRSFGEAFPGAAEAEIAENVEADPSFIDAVDAAAAAIVEQQAAGSLAVEEMAAYPALVDALRADHARAIAEILAEQERLAEIERQNNLNNGGGSGGAPTNPTDPTDPVVPGDTEEGTVG